MRKAESTKQAIRRIDLLTGRRSEKLFSLSPNDVLVQIALPLILILAIATRLMMMHHQVILQQQQQGPAILDLWKQVLIQRLDAVMDEWQSDVGLELFPSIDRVQWGADGWPADQDFSRTCQQLKALNDVSALQHQLYQEALLASDDSGLHVLYDPALNEGPPPENLPKELFIDEEKRAYALAYIHRRTQEWKTQALNLQWGLINRVLQDLPPDTPLADKDLSVQMNNLSLALDQQGYPLLNTIRTAYAEETP